MTSNGKTGHSGQSASGGQSPDWADGLKQLYDDVVDEPIPDTFKDLLAQFDADDDAGDATGDGGGA